MEYPLEGLRVLDFSRVLAGPFAARMLADLGADVVKVEPPDGDVTRYWGLQVGNVSGYYHQQNAGKRNICIDLRAEGAATLVRQLAEVADIVIENYRPDVMDRLGIGYRDLSATNKKLVMLSISGFGRGGPESHRAAYAPVIHAETGLIHRSSRKYGVKPHDLPLSVADTNASLHGLVGILSALHMRQRTGKGQHIDIAMVDATIATDDQLHYDLEAADGTGPLPNEIWETAIGPVLLSTDFRLLFRLLVSKHGLVDPADPGMSLEEKIAARRKAVTAFINTLNSKEKFAAAMRAINVAWGEVRDPADIQSQPTVRAREAIIEVDDRAGGVRPITQSPYRFSDARSGVRGPAPHRGEHHAQVLQEWLSFTEDDVRGLHEKAVLHFDPEWRHGG